MPMDGSEAEQGIQAMLESVSRDCRMKQTALIVSSTGRHRPTAIAELMLARVAVDDLLFEETVCEMLLSRVLKLSGW